MELATSDIRLDCAALRIAHDAYPEMDLLRWLGELDQLADEVADVRPGLSAPLRYQAMRTVLVEQHQFRGDDDDYYHPDNSYLNRVLERRLGIPITLAVVWIEVGRRLKWPVSGVGFPGNFLVRFDDPERYVVADPFRGGCSLSAEDCSELLAKHTDGQVPFTTSLLRPIDTRGLLSRMLHNLRAIHLAHQDWPRLESVLQRLIALEPESARHYQELIAARCRQGDLTAALRTAARLLRGPLPPAVVPAVQSSVRQIGAALASLN